jgi:ankyrin repeat protein
MFIRKHSGRHPIEFRGFGGDLLIGAIEKQKGMLINILARKTDVNAQATKVSSGLCTEIAFSTNGIIVNGYCTAFGFAIQYERGTHVELVRQLIDAGGDLKGLVLNAMKFFNQYGMLGVLRTALLLAIETSSEKMVKLLLSHGADPHQAATRGLKRTPLQQACEVGNFNVVNLLLEWGADVNEAPALDSGATSLQLASMSGNIRIAKLLLSRGANVHAPKARVNGKTALEGAAENGRMHMIETLRSAVGGQGFTHEEIDSAIRLAEHDGHHGCAQYIRDIFGNSACSSSLLDGDLFTDSQLVVLP